MGQLQVLVVGSAGCSGDGRYDSAFLRHAIAATETIITVLYPAQEASHPPPASIPLQGAFLTVTPSSGRQDTLEFGKSARRLDTLPALMACRQPRFPQGDRRTLRPSC